MSDSAETASFEAVPDPGQPVTASAGASWSPDSGSQAAGPAEHPELMVGAAFVGGLLLATILKRFAD